MAARTRKFTTREREVIAAGGPCQWKDSGGRWKSARLRDTVVRTDSLREEYVDAVNLTPSKTIAANSPIRIYPGRIRGGR